MYIIAGFGGNLDYTQDSKDAEQLAVTAFSENSAKTADIEPAPGISGAPSRGETLTHAATLIELSDADEDFGHQQQAEMVSLSCLNHTYPLPSLCLLLFGLALKGLIRPL